jgi:hypothetical protein
LKLQYLKLSLSILTLLPAVTRGATILSENFDTLTPQLTVTSAGAFTAIGGTNVDIVGPSNGYGFLCAAPESGNCLDMDGSNGNSQGQIESASIILNPGTTYFLSFDLIGSGRGLTTSTTVSFGPFSQTFDLPSGDTTDGIVVNTPITVGSTTTTNLVFTSNTPGNVGAVLDDVLITSGTASTVPEPSALMMLTGPVLLAAGVLIRRRSRVK